MKNNGIFLSVALSALMASASVASAQSSKLTVAWYGGNWGDAFQACVAQPFTAATGIEVVADIGTSSTTLAKLQQQAGTPTIDVAYMDGGFSELADAAGVLDAIDTAGIPNAAHLIDGATYRAGDRVYALGSGYYSLGLTYRTDSIPQAPTSWNALWDDAHAGAVTIPSPNNSAGIPFIYFVNRITGGTPDDFEPTLKRLADLDVAMFFDSSGAASNAFQSGEVVIGAHFNAAAWALIDAGLPVGFVVPEEGVWATDVRLHLVKGSQNTEAAQRFIDTAISAEASRCLAERLYLGPAVDNVTLPADVSRKLPWGAAGSIKDLLLLDWNDVNARRAQLTEAWNRQVAR